MGLNEHNNFDVIIIGGGPAGASAGIHLKKAGLSIAIFEKETFPRPHVGESLVPFCYELFEDLGVLDTLIKTTVRKPGVRFTNSSGSSSTTYYFNNVLKGPNQLSFHVLREKFDKQLLDKAKELGVEVFENHKVTNIDLTNPSKAFVTCENNGKKKQTEASFLIDATGQDTFLANKMRTKSKHKELQRTAFLRHWDCQTNREDFKEGVLQILYLDGHKKGWIGIQPVDENRVSLGLIINNDYLKSNREKYKSDNWKEEFYEEEILLSPFIKKILDGAKPVNDLLVVGDYSYTVDQKFGHNYALVGDSAGFLDPIFATGVYLALNSSKITSSAIITYLTKDKKTGLEELQNAYSQYKGAFNLVEKFIYNFYDPSFINLAEIGKEVSSKDKSYTKHLIAFSMLHFLMGGDFFNEHKKYSEFIEFLKEPKQLARYLHMVIENPANKSSGKRYTIDEIYPMLKS